jgi:SpoIID/LytB domain protein
MAPRRQTPYILRAAACAAAVLLTAASVLSCPSTARADAIFAVSGRGWGHGIGMTQYGAMGYAQQGKSYTWILAHYFQQTSLATRPQLTVKVDLDASKSARSSWHIEAASSSTTLTVADLANASHSVVVTRGADVWITFSAGGAVVKKNHWNGSAGKNEPGSVLGTFSGAVIASTGSTTASKVKIMGPSGPFSHNALAWRGQIRFTPNTTTGHALDYVPMEQYLRGVVPRESGSSWPKEALRAQAVAARSYAYDSASSGTVLYCTTMSQVYGGADGEAATTDAAVADTANQFVVYGSKVIETFFSSSSGGRTANSKDVWFSSKSDDVSPVYYTSVEDADDVGSNPNYRWTLADMSGATLAAKIRDRDNGSKNTDPLEYSVASPATVTNVTLDAGDSGFIRYVTMKWSNGKSFTITGPTFQFALGLKSSAFAVKLKNPPAPPATRYQETDGHPLWTGAWTTRSAASASGGTYRRAAAAGASLTVMFKGTSVAWIATKSDHAGKADVLLDGVRVTTIDLYSASTKYRSTAWTKTGLSATATHTLVVKALGTHRSGSGGSYVYVDAVDVAGSLIAVPRPPVWKRYEQTTAAAHYTGAWKTSTLSGLSGGTHAFSRETSASVTFSFTGSRARWIGKRASNYGKAWVSVDASAPVLVDLYSSTVLNQQRLFESTVLPSGPHTLTIRVSGKKNSKASTYYVDADAFEALEPAK